MSESLPAHAPVVVIGGGIMGCSTLYHLAKMGVSDAILLERNRLTSGTTWHSAAQVRALRHSRNLTRMIQYSVELYAQLEAETGQSVGWIRKGSLSIATTPDRLIHIRRQAALAHAYGIEAHEIVPGEAKERWPLMNADDVLGAVWSPEDGRVSPSDVCAALGKAARGLGAQFFENTGVTGILTQNGRVRGVETGQGVVMCDAVALCAGLWSREVGAMAGAGVPLLACEHFYLLTRPVEGVAGNLPTLSDHDRHLYIRDDSGGLLVGCFEPMGKPIPPGVLDETFEFQLLPEDWDHFEPMMENALHRLPALETAEVRMLLNGPESFTPDGMFLLGETAETRGLFLGCGMNSVGIACGGGAGMNLAHAIVHGHTAYDLSEAEANRFAPQFDSVEHLMARAPEVLGRHYEIAFPGIQPATARDSAAAAARRRTPRSGRAYGPVLRLGTPALVRQSGGTQADLRHARLVREPYARGHGRPPQGRGLRRLALRQDRGRGAGCRRLPAACLRQRHGPAAGQRHLHAGAERARHLRIRYHRAPARRRPLPPVHRRRCDPQGLAWLRRHADRFDVTLADVTERYAVLGLMGPDSARIAAQLGAPELNGLGYFRIGPTQIAGCPVRAARLSYVGEAGWEMTCRAGDAPAVYAALTGAGAVPAGLYAQTSMRIEKGFAAMGHETRRRPDPGRSGDGPLLLEGRNRMSAAMRSPNAGKPAGGRWRSSCSRIRMPCRWVTSRSTARAQSSAAPPPRPSATGSAVRSPSAMSKPAKSMAGASKSISPAPATPHGCS